MHALYCSSYSLYEVTNYDRPVRRTKGKGSLICIVLSYELLTLKRSGSLRHVLTRDNTVLPSTHTFIHKWNEPLLRRKKNVYRILLGYSGDRPDDKMDLLWSQAWLVGLARCASVGCQYISLLNCLYEPSDNRIPIWRFSMHAAVKRTIRALFSTKEN